MAVTDAPIITRREPTSDPAWPKTVDDGARDPDYITLFKREEATVPRLFADSWGTGRAVYISYFAPSKIAGQLNQNLEQFVTSSSVRLAGVLQSKDTEKSSVGALTVQFRRRVAIADKTTLFGTDPSGVLDVVAEVTGQELSLSLDLQFDADTSVLPRELLPILRFLRTLYRAHQLTLTIGDDVVGEVVIEGNIEFPQAIVEAVRSLAFVQAIAGNEFPAPTALNNNDLRELHEAETLLTAGTVTSQWSEAELGATDRRWLEAVQGSSEFTLDFIAPAVAQIAGHIIPLGEASYTFHAAVIHETSAGNVVLRPGSDDRLEIILVTPPEISPDLQKLRPPIMVSAEALDQVRQHPIGLNVFRPPTR